MKSAKKQVKLLMAPKKKKVVTKRIIEFGFGKKSTDRLKSKEVTLYEWGVKAYYPSLSRAMWRRTPFSTCSSRVCDDMSTLDKV